MKEIPDPQSQVVTTDTRLDAHHRQQLSALYDGELGSDQARFLLRRLQHDPELAACQERWQLLGDVLRGQACAPAPVDFSARVAAAVAAEPLPSAQPVQRAHRGWRSWGGGAALAASVAAVALFMGRQGLQEPVPGAEMPVQVIASQAELSLPATPATPVTEAGDVLAAGAPALAVAAATRAQQAQSVRRASATRTQQAARSVQRDDEPLRALAGQAPFTPTVPSSARRELPFGDVGALQARPWPRSSIGPAAGGALNASAPGAGGAFYPFEPRQQEMLPAPRPQD